MIELIHKYMTWRYSDRLLIALGFIVLLWYTIETYRLRKIGKDQLDIQILPLPFLYISATSIPRLIIKNIGAGTAIDIKVKPVEFTYDGKKKRFEFEVNYNYGRGYGSNTLQHNEKLELISVIFYVDGIKKSTELSIDAFINYFAPNGKFMVDEGRDIIVTFKDIKAQSYELKHHFSKSGSTIAQLPKRVKQK